MANGIGVSYQPGAGSASGRQDRAVGFRKMSPQEAVRILSLRVPERSNPTAPISRELMMAPGGSAAGADAFTSMVAQLMRQTVPPLYAGGAYVPGGDEVSDAVRGPSMPTFIPTPDGGSARVPSAPPPSAAPPLTRVRPGNRHFDEDMPEEPPQEPPQSVSGADPVTPGLFDDDAAVTLPPWLRSKQGSIPSLFADDVRFT